MQRNELKKAKERLKKVIEISKMGIEEAETKFNSKQHAVICIQAYYYLSKV